MHMQIIFLTPLSIVCAGIAAFLFGWLWYSKMFFMKWWLEGNGVNKNSLPERKKQYMVQVMTYTFIIGTSMTAVLSIILELSQVESLKQALAMSMLIAVGMIGLKNFMEMLHTMPETYFSVKAQKKFFVDTGYYVCMFAIATIVMYYVGTHFGI